MNALRAKFVCLSILVLLVQGCSLVGLDELDVPACDQTLCDARSEAEGLSDSCYAYRCAPGGQGCTIQGPRDDDDDGFPDGRTCADAGLDASLDCDDGDPGIKPDASEVCDGVDNDCDGKIDADDTLEDAPTAEHTTFACRTDADGGAGWVVEDCDKGYLACGGLSEGCDVGSGSLNSCNRCNTDCKFACEEKDCDGPECDEPGCDEIVQIGIGLRHACARTRTGRVACWGDNEYGQLGIGTQGSTLAPAPVWLNAKASTIGVGDYHACAIVDAELYCWGDNSQGQLGIYPPKELSRVPERAALTLSGVIAVAAGAAHTCAVHDGVGLNGNLACWGQQQHGRLGNGESAEGVQIYEMPVVQADLSFVNSARTVVAGTDFTCVLTEEGRVRCFGNNEWGQLGDDSTSEFSAFAQPVYNLQDVSLLTARHRHTCALVGNQGLCWGHGGFRQLGSRNSADADIAMVVPGLPPIEAISAGRETTCVVTSEGSVLCWGGNQHGERGNEAAEDSSVPVEVALPGADLVYVSNSTCARILRSRQVMCWGHNAYGILTVSPSSNPQPTPTQLSPLIENRR